MDDQERIAAQAEIDRLVAENDALRAEIDERESLWEDERQELLALIGEARYRLAQAGLV